MKRAALTVAMLGAMSCAVAVAVAAPDAFATHFSHAAHAKRLTALPAPAGAGAAGLDNASAVIDACETCHSVNDKGQVAAPAALGHAPCMNAGCHATDFLAVAAAARTANPGAYAKATAFCLGCHDSKDGAPPSPWARPTTGAALQSFQYEREYHVEMNHLEHALRAECRSCHAVDPASFALVASAPGHAQCVACHNAKKFPQFTMEKCAVCHDKPARADYFHGTRPKIDVRACGSEGHTALEAKLKHKVSCFRHERVEHRTADGAAVQCAACHYMVGDKSKWNGRRYQTLRDLHVDTIIDNSQDRQHKSCGRSGCHQADVDAGRAGAKCSLCHAEKSAF